MKVVGSNPSTVYWMHIFTYILPCVVVGLVTSSNKSESFILVLNSYAILKLAYT